MLLAAAGLPAYSGGAVAGGQTGAASNATRPSAASALMKTLSVRLHRGTEFIKDTVQKALVMSAPTPVAPAPPPPPVKHLQLDSQGLKRKLSGAGGLMGCGSAAANTASSSTGRSSHYILSHSQQQPTCFLPSTAFLKTFTVAPTALHRSATARKRNPSTDSLLMDLCLFKPIRPMPITPIKINKARGFELKKPKYVPVVTLYSEDEEDNEPQPQPVHKPKHSTLTLPPHEESAFVPMPYIEITTKSSIQSCHNTHTSGTGKIAKPRRRRRAPLLTAKRRRQVTVVEAEIASETTPAPPPPPITTAGKRKANTCSTARRKRRCGEGNAADSSISPASRPSPPMTRQRARQQISANSN